MDLESKALYKYLRTRKGGKAVLQKLQEESKQNNISLIKAFNQLYQNHPQREKILTGIEQQIEFLKKDKAGEARTLMDKKPDRLYEGQIPRTQQEAGVTKTIKPSDEQDEIKTMASEQMMSENGLDLGEEFEEEEQKQDPLGSMLKGDSKTKQTKPKGIDNFIPIQKLGEGGMGIVLKAKDTALDREIALKKYKGKIEQENIARFTLEARITGGIEHQGIPPVHEFLEDEIAFVMKYVQGEDLSEIITKLKQKNKEYKEKYNLNELLRIFIKACEPLAYAHSKGIIHRDLKPENIMIGQFGEVQVMDWGLGKRKGTPDITSDSVIPNQEDPNLTMAGSIMGTPMYMSPEQANAKTEEIDSQSDIYSLGATLFEMLSQKKPIPGETIQNILLNVIKGKQNKAKGIPKELQSIIKKTMSKNKKKRYPTAEKLIQDIQKYLDGEMVRAHRYRFTEKVKRLVKKYSTQITAGATVMLALAAGTGGMLYTTAQAQKAKAEKIQAQAKEKQAKLEAKTIKAEKQKIQAEAETKQAKLETTIAKQEKEKEKEKLEAVLEAQERRNRSNRISLRGEVLYEENAFEMAIVACKDAIQADNQNHYPYFIMGKILREKGNIDLAISQLEKAVELDKNNTGYISELAYTLEISGKISEAEQKYLEGVKKYMQRRAAKDGNPRIILNTGAHYSRQNEHLRAIEFYNEYIDEVPDNKKAIYARIAGQYAHLGDSTNTIKFAKKSIEEGFIGGHYELGVGLFLEKKWKEAEQHLKQARPYRPDRQKNIADFLDVIEDKK